MFSLLINDNVRARSGLLLIAILMLTACGYHLRGALDLPEALKKMYVQGASAELSEAIKRTFRGGSGELVATPEEAGMILNVIDEDYQRRTVSLSSAGYSNEYELSYRLTFDLLDAEGNKLITEQTIEVMEAYFNAQRSETLLSKDNEEIILRQGLYEEAVLSVIRRARAELKKTLP